MARHYIDNLLGEREKIIHTSHQHWFILVRNILAEIIAIFILITATVLLAIYLNNRYQTPHLLTIAVGFLLTLLPILSMVRDFLIFTNRQYLITNRRVIQISGVINKNVTDSSLEKVTDLIMTQSALGRIFNYGDVEILTASEMGANIFKRIEKPVRFKTALLNAKEALDRGDYGDAHREELSIPALIEQLDQLRQKGSLSDVEFQEKKAELLSKL